MALTATLQSTQDVMKRLDAGAAPALKRLPDIAAGLEGTVTRANKLLGGMDAGYGPGSQVNRDLARILVELTDTARSVRVLADLLTRHPEALIRGRTNTGAQ
jgi:paraquat-inducible protein B